jgi:hypothetical protein
MKKTTLAIAALLSTLSVASIAPAYAEDAAPSTDATTAAPADCKPGDKNCTPDTHSEGSTDSAAPATTDSGS